MRTVIQTAAAGATGVPKMRFGVLLLLAAFLMSVPLAFAGSAQALKSTTPASNYPALSQIKGSKGYKIGLSSISYLGSKTVQLTASKGGHSVSYSTKPSKASLTVIKAKFGKLGSVSLKFKATGKPKKEKKVKGCTGRSVSTKGVFRGKVKFKGSHGFTSVNVKKVKATIYKTPKRTCHFPKPKPPKNPGTTTSLSISPPLSSSKSWSLYASKTSEDAKASYSFYSSADIGTVSATETINVSAKKSTFTSNAGATTGTIKPPAPFQGSATVNVVDYDATASGNLKFKSALQGTINFAAANVRASLGEFSW